MLHFALPLDTPFFPFEFLEKLPLPPHHFHFVSHVIAYVSQSSPSPPPPHYACCGWRGDSVCCVLVIWGYHFFCVIHTISYFNSCTYYYNALY